MMHVLKSQQALNVEENIVPKKKRVYKKKVVPVDVPVENVPVKEPKKIKDTVAIYEQVETSKDLSRDDLLKLNRELQNYKDSVELKRLKSRQAYAKRKASEIDAE
jgi:hypothetical protein